MSPTKRSLKALRYGGYTCAIVERWNPYAKIRQDLFGVIDILAIHPDYGIFGVQTTSDNGGIVAKHVHKCKAEPRLLVWLESGGKFIIHGWGKRGPRGKRKVWTCRTLTAKVGRGLYGESYVYFDGDHA